MDLSNDTNQPGTPAGDGAAATPFVSAAVTPVSPSEVSPGAAPQHQHEHHVPFVSHSSPSAEPPAPVAPTGPADFGAGASPTAPVPVVRVLSPAGVEYVFLTIALFTAAAGLTAALLSLVNGKTSFSVLAFPTALLVVGLPVFALLFLRLKKLELAQPALKLDASKRRSTQFTQIVSFLICLFTLVGLVGSIFAKLGGELHDSIGKTILDCLVLLVVFGGLLAYYWSDEHRSR